jgi:hypothetical protein
MAASALSLKTFALRSTQAVIISVGLPEMEVQSRRPQVAGDSRFFPGE